MYDSQTLKSRRNLMRLFWPVCQKKKTWTWNRKTYFRIPDLSLITVVTGTGHLTLLSLQFLICRTGMIIAPCKVTVMIQRSSLQHIGLAQKFLWENPKELLSQPDTWPHIGISYMLVLFLPPTGFITGPSEIDEILLCLDLQKGGSICQSPLLVFPKSFCWDVSPYLSSQRNYFLLCASHTIVITVLAVTPKSVRQGSLICCYPWRFSVQTWNLSIQINIKFKRKSYAKRHKISKQLKGGISMHHFLSSCRSDLPFLSSERRVIPVVVEWTSLILWINMEVSRAEGACL